MQYNLHQPMNNEDTVGHQTKTMSLRNHDLQKLKVSPWQVICYLKDDQVLYAGDVNIFRDFV